MEGFLSLIQYFRWGGLVDEGKKNICRANKGVEIG